MYGFQSRASDSVGGKAECPALERLCSEGLELLPHNYCKEVPLRIDHNRFGAVEGLRVATSASGSYV